MSNSCLNEKNFRKGCPPFDCMGCEDTLFRKVIIPMVLGDDKKYPPENGAYRNALVVYEANGAIYLYSSDGLYTKLDVPSGVTSVNGMTGDVTLDIPSKVSDLINDLGFIDKNVNNLTYYSKTSSFGSVAFSNSYNDLKDKPVIGNAELTINRNGNAIGSFRANATSPSVVNIAVPTSTSELINNSNFVVDDHYVHTDRNFTNELRTKLVKLANIQEIGTGLTLRNGRLDATGGGGGGVTQIYRGETEPTDENILIWIDTSAPTHPNAMLTSEGDWFITSEGEDFVVADWTSLYTSDNNKFMTNNGEGFALAEAIPLYTNDNKEFIEATNKQFITKGGI